MRLKNIDGPLSVRNGNNDIINSPKRINTVQNSNVTSNSYLTSSDQDCLDNNDVITLETSRLNNIDNSKVQWCTPKVELTNNANNRLFNINNTLAISLANNARHGTASSVCSESSPDDSLLDYEEAHQSCSSVDTSPQEEEEDRGFDITDSESEEGNVNTIHRRGIVNPNYPGFQHLAHTLDYNFKSDSDEDEYDSKTKLDAEANNINNNNNDSELSVNRLDSVENIQKVFYDKPVFNISNDITEQIISDESNIEVASTSTSYQVSSDDDESNINAILKSCNVEQIDKELEDTVEKLNTIDFEVLTKFDVESNVEESFDKPVVVEKLIFDDSKTVIDSEMALIKTNFDLKLSDAFLSSVQDKIPEIEPGCFKKEEGFAICDDSNRKVDDDDVFRKINEMEKFCKEDLTKGEKEKDDDSTVPRKKEKIEFVKKRRDYSQHIGSLITIPRRDIGLRGKEYLNRRSLPLTKEKKRISPDYLGGFDVYNIETAMPKIDLEAIESHLRAAREEERRRRTDREEIRRRLAMGNEEEYYSDRPGRKPSLQARLQSGMNLQICFMNETASDTESPSSDSECTLGKPKQIKTVSKSTDFQNNPPTRPSTLPIAQQPIQKQTDSLNETDFFAKQARLQTEARMALAQAKEMARMQMEIERQRQKKSPITEMVRHSMEKVGIPFPEDRRRLSRQILTEMNVAQLQVIVNDLHTQIENLNENLVKFLMDRDDLHMEQDSMLVDIEDLTRFLGAREQSVKEHNLAPSQNNNVAPPSPAPASPLASLNNSVKPHLHRIASFVKK